MEGNFLPLCGIEKTVGRQPNTLLFNIYYLKEELESVKIIMFYMIRAKNREEEL